MVKQTPAPKPATEGHASTVGGLEVRSINYVPLAERHGKVWHLWPIWFTGDAHLATIAVGVLGISLGSNLIWTAIAIVAGGAFGTFFMAFHSTQGPQLGLPQMIQSRPQFGYVGALLVFVVALISYVGFNAFNQVLAGDVAHETLNINPHYIFIPFGVLAALLALVGYDLIHKAQRYLAYLLLAALTIFTIGIIVLHPFTAADFDLGNFNRNAFLVQFFAAATYQLSWAIYVSDYSRYLPPTVGVRASFWWTFLGAWIGGFWMMLVGTFAASMFNKDNVVSSVIQAGDAIFGGFGTILIVLAFLGLLTITGLNFYGASLTLLSAYDSIKPLKATLNTRIVALVVVAVSATTIAYLASGNFITTFGTFIHFLGLLFAPWTAINLIDFYYVRKTHYSIRAIFEPHGGIYGRWNWRGLLAYGLGFISMIPFTASASYEGPVAKALGGADISMIIGLLVGGAVYLLAYRSFDLEAERLAVDKADIGLDPDAPNGIPYAAVPHGKRK